MPLKASESIWPRLIAGMRLGGEQRPEVQRFIRHYRANPEYFTAMLARAEPFLWFVLHSAEQRSQPTELALLPAVESGWDPHAVSVSSAYGLWQFIPKTGDAYGLRDALNYDARRDPVASTRVALDLLDELHGEYGDWSLALAAYNTGGVRVKQAMKTGRTRDFWRLPLPPVTKDYVPRLLAIAALVRNPQRYGVSLPPITEADVAEVVSLDQDAPLHLALEAAGVNQDVLRMFNPGMHISDAPTRSPTLLLPPADAMAVRAELAYLRQEPIPLQVASATAVLRPDAQMAMPEPVIKKAASEAVFPVLAQQMHWDANIGSASQTASMRFSAASYEVRTGDTLFGIAQRHGISVAQLKRMNPEARNAALKPGQTIKLNDCARRSCG